MEQPYDDSQPYPPEWEDSNDANEKAEKMIQCEFWQRLLPLLPDDQILTLAKSVHDEVNVVLTRYAILCSFGGNNQCVEVKNAKELPSEPYFRGFHAAIFINLNEDQIKQAGLTKADVNEVWTVYTDQLKNYFHSIKNVCKPS